MTRYYHIKRVLIQTESPERWLLNAGCKQQKAYIMEPALHGCRSLKTKMNKMKSDWKTKGET